MFRGTLHPPFDVGLIDAEFMKENAARQSAAVC
jgi:hypothetical protein